MPVLKLQNGTILTLTTITPDQLLEFEDHLLNSQLHPSDLLLLATQIPSFNIREQLLLIIDRCTQFLPFNENNKVFLFALYVQEIIRTYSYLNSKNNYSAKYIKLSEQINNILQMDIDTPSFNVIKGYYFIFLKKYENATFLLERNGSNVAKVGMKIINAVKGRRSRGGDGVDSLCNWYINKKERRESNDYKVLRENFPMLKKFENMPENIDQCLNENPENIDTLQDENNIDVINVKKLYTDNYYDIEELRKYKSIDCESFQSDLNYFMGRFYHMRKDYLAAVEYYKKSKHPSAIYNLMRITRVIIDTDSKYHKIQNYIYLVNNQDDKLYLENNDSIYKIKKDEKWCGHAIIGYFKLLSSDCISKSIVVNNLVYFYDKCVKENEILAIEDFSNKMNDKYGDIKNILADSHKENFHNLDLLSDVKNNIVYVENGVYNGVNQNLLFICNLYLSYLLCQSDDNTTLYNLSFFLKDAPAVQILKLINTPTSEVLLRLSFLTDSLNMINDLAKFNEAMATAYKGYYHYKHENIKQAKESFTLLLQKDRKDFLHYGYLALAYIHTKNKKMDVETVINYLKKGLLACKNSQVIVYNIGVAMAIKGKQDIAKKIFVSILSDERNDEYIMKLCSRGISKIEGLVNEEYDNVENIKRIKGIDK